MLVWKLQRKRQKTVFFTVCLLAVVSLFLYANAQNDDAYRFETVHVFPGSIKTTDWENPNIIRNQNTSSYALYQDFNTINSATLGPRTSQSTQKNSNANTNDTENVSTPTQPVLDTASEPDTVVTETVSTTVTDTDSATTSATETTPVQFDAGETDNDTPSTPDTSESNTEAATAGTDDVVEDETAESAPEPVPESDTSTDNNTAADSEDTASLLNRSPLVVVTEFARSLWPFANEATTTEVHTDTAEAKSAGDVTTSTVPSLDEEVVEMDETQSEVDVSFETATVTAGAVEVDTNGSTTNQNDTMSSDPMAATTSKDETETVSSIASTTAPEDTIDETDITTNTVPCSDNCDIYSLQFTDFGLPIFTGEDALELAGGQLRFSLAAKTKDQNVLSPHSFSAYYSFDDGDSWQLGGELALEGEVTNATNGGYFLFSLPSELDAAMLDALQVELRYTGDQRELDGLFLDSVWLELFTVAPPVDAPQNIPSNDPLANGFVEGMLSGDTLDTGAETINFTFTDDNSGETLIIKSSAKEYAGLTKATSYISVTNTSDKTDEFYLQTHFPEKLGEVTSIKEWNQNKPFDTVIPEYQPYVYHCDGGWAATEKPVNATIQDLSRYLSAPVATSTIDLQFPDEIPGTAGDDVETTDAATDDTEAPTMTEEASTNTMVVDTATTTTATSTDTDNDTNQTDSTNSTDEAGSTGANENISTSTTTNATPTASDESDEAAVPAEPATISTSSQVLLYTPIPREWLQAVSTTTATATTVDQATSELPNPVTPAASTTTPASIDLANTTNYQCAGTSVIRSCDEVTGGTDCRVEAVKVREHNITAYRGGWETLQKIDGAAPEPGFFRRAASIFGFGPDKKDLPELFEARAHAADKIAIAPGETKYFEVAISYPPRSTGEFWIEAIGDTEYGLLDPFWQSTWRKRLPITIDNTGNASTTEQQVFISLDTATTSFWNTVREDGGDIRFVQQEAGTSHSWFDQAYEFRKPIPVTIGPNRPAGGYDGYTVQVELDTDTLIGDGDMLASCNDLRVVYGNGTGAIELNRVVSDCNTSATNIAFALQADHATSSVQNDYYIYYGDGTAGAPPADAEQVFLWYDDGSSDRLSEYTSDQGDAWHGTGVSNTFAFNAGGYYTFDTDDNFNESLRIPNSTLSERDVYIETEFFIDNCYPVNISKGLFARYINDASYYASMHGNTSGLGSCTGGYTNTGDIVKGARTTTLINGTDPGALTNGTWRKVALAAWSINNTNLKYWDVNNSTNFGPAGFPTVAPLADGADTGTDIENPGEVGIMVAQVGGRVRNIIVRRYTEAEPVVATTTPAETFSTGTFTELDHWVQYFSTTTQEADVWIQTDNLPANASTTIYMYYDNPVAESTSDEYAPFTYSSPRDLYYVVNDGQTTPLVVYSLIDDNEVSIDGNTPVTLQSGESTSFTTYTAASVISANGPVTARTTNNAGDNLVPISFASTTLVIPSTRGTESVYTYAPFSSTIVEMFDGNSGTPVQSGTTNVGTAAVYTNNNGQATIIEADEPILVFSRNGTNDGLVVYPPTLRDLFGIHSQNYYYSPTQSSTNISIFCSSSNSGTDTGVNRGAQSGNGFCVNGTQGTGNAVRLTNQTSPVAAIQQADSDGGESTMFLPTPEFGTRYIIPQTAEYVSVVCAPRFGTTSIEVRSAVGTTLATSTCATSVDFPGAVNFTPGSPYAAGTQVVSPDNVPFYMYYEEDSQDDETNTWSAVQAKQFGSLDLTSELGDEEPNTDAQYTQNNFAWYENIDDATPSTRWSLGEEDAFEGENIIGGGAINSGDQLRLRINLEANNGTGTVASTAFALQYIESPVEQCGTAVSNAWVTVPGAGSTTAAFTGFNNAGVSDGVTLPSALLSDTTVLGSYEEANFSSTLPNQVNPGNIVEFDWVLQAESLNVNSNYCFRLVRSTSQDIAAYDVYPAVETAGPPEKPILFTPFANEHVSSTVPAFEFVASDIAGDDIDYQIQVSTDVNFSSTVIDSQATNNLFDFENLQIPSDFAPFNNTQRIRYTPTISLNNGTTYWWRVRAADPDGSDSFGSWSNAQSFTINTAVTVTEWYQTTDEQFDTNTLDSAQTSGSDSVELDIAGGNLIGEYGTLTVNVGATTTVNLDNSYTNPVVVVSHRYARSTVDGDQPVIRVFNKGATAFDFLAYTYDFDPVGTTTVDYIVVEAGEYLMADGEDGVRVFATSTSVSTIVGRSVPANPGGPVITFPTSFSAPPTVLAAVTTNNDPQWVVATVYDGTNRVNPPTATQVGLYLNDSLASDGHGSAEDIDIIALDPKANGVNNAATFESLRTPDSVSNTPFTQSFASSFTSTPGVILVHQQNINGGDGGYAMIDIDTSPTASQVTVAFEEGGTGGDRGHTTETVGIVAFESSGSDIIRGSNAQITSTLIDFDDVKLGNAWGEVRWNKTGDVTVRVQYQTGSGFQNIPNSALPGNSVGFNSSPINILDLDTTIYNELRLVAVLSGVNPELFDWTVAWGQRVEIPTMGDPFDNQKVGTTTPTFDFVTTDPQSDDLEYEISISTDPTFNSSSSTFNSGSDAGFTGSTASPFPSGIPVTYTTQAALTDGETYWWRVRARDPGGDNSFSPWSNPDAFTVDTSVVVSTWHQTTQAQFRDGVFDGTFASTSNSVEVLPNIGEYGTTTLTNNEWLTVTTDITYGNMVVVASPEFDFNGSDNGRTVRVRNKTSNSFEIKVDDYTNAFAGTTEVDYVVMEAGEWLIADGGGGTRIIAGTAEDVSNVKGNAGYDNSIGEIVTFSPSFGTAPGALLTVASNNDPTWVGTVMDDGVDVANPITTSQMNISLARGKDTAFHDPEDIDYLVFAVNTGTNAGVLFDGFNSPRSVTHDDTLVNFNQTGFTVTPAVTLVQSNGIAGGQGGFAQKDLTNPSSNTQLNLSVSENGPNADNHAAEFVSVLAFEAGSGQIQRDISAGGGGLSGTIRSETIDFFDGNGPRFEQFYWNNTTPGTSDVRVQVEYFDGFNWNLVPDDDWYNLNWTRRVPITLQADQIEEDLTDFPVYVDLGDLDSIFWDNVLGNGNDIRVTQSDGTTELPFDLTYIDTGSDDGELHFKTDLASTTNQTFFIYFGNVAASPYAPGDPFGAQNVWTNNYDARHQLGQNPTASAPQFTDSTGNGYNATAKSGMSAANVVPGQVGRAIDLDDTDGGFFDIDFSYPGAFTASMWWNSSGDGFAISRDSGSTEKFGPWTGGNLFTRMLNSQTADTSVPSPVDGSWSYVVLQRNADDKIDVYIDGVQIRIFSDDAQSGVSTWENFGGQNGQGFVGQLDELRFATGTRSLGWFDTEYNNQGNPGAFYQVGVVQQSSGDALIGNNVGFTGGGPIDISGLDANVYNTIRLLATLECGGGDCPTLDDWSVEWGEGVLMSGTLQAPDRSTNVPSGTIRVAVNGNLQAGSGSVSNGNWSIGNVTAFNGDVITVYVEGSADAKRAVTSFVYNGAGNMTGVEMYEKHFTLAGDNSLPVTNALLDSYDNVVAGNTDVFFNVNGLGELVVCAVANCDDFSLYITDGITYRPNASSAGNIATRGFLNEGIFTLDGNTMRVGGNWSNQATSSLGTGEIIFTATTGSYTVTDHTNQLTFPTLTFGESSGTATWQLMHPLTVTNDWTVNYGTVDRFLAPQVVVSGDIAIGSGGVLLGSGTTTFAGTGASTWDDDSAGQNLGNVLIDGTSKTVSVTSDVYANNLFIGANDTLQGGTSNVIHVGGNFTNTGTFTPNTSTIELIDDERGRQTPGVQPEPWYDTDWSSRYPITIQASQIDDDLTDFPVTVSLADLPADFWTEVKNNGGDIRVTTADALTEVAREISAVNIGSETGELYFKAPNLSSTTDTTFYIYFGNTAATDYAVGATYGAEAVWSDYEAVWHFAEGTGSVAGDSTSNNNDGTLVGSPNWTTGKSGGALQFNGSGNSGNRVTVPGFLTTATTTVSVWFTQNAVQSGNGNWTYVLHSSSDQNVGSSNFWLGRLGSPDPDIGDIGATVGGWSSGLGHSDIVLEPDNRYYHVTAVQADGQVRLYVDGQLVRTRSQSMFTFTSEDWGIGAATGGNRSHPGIIDSPRVSTMSRSSAWVAAEYRNVATTTDFYSVGTAEGAIGVAVSPAVPHEVTTGGANLYRFTMNDPVTSASFVESTVTVQNNFSIATGTVALPATLLSVGGNFANTGGVFMHNNSEIRFTGSGTKTIEQQGTAFLNAFYDVVFTGNGNWSYVDTNATTTNTYSISNGNVTFPSGQLSVGNDFIVSGSGGFNANNGEVLFLSSEGVIDITPRTSEFHNLRIQNLGGSGWLDNDFAQRIEITIPASVVDDDVSNFPVFVDLSLLGSNFFSEVTSDGADIRMTEGDGFSEVPVEVVGIDTGAETGELHFRATTLSSTTDSVFYLYFDNPGATAVADGATYGRNNVWSNGYEAVYHLPTTTDSTGNGYTLTESNISNSSSALMGEAADFNGSNSVYTYGDPQTVLNGFSEFTLSMWYESDVIDTDKGMFMASTINGGDNGICARYDTAGANAGGDDVFKGCLDTTSGGNQQYESSEFVQTTDYQYYVQTWQAGDAQEIYFDAVADTFTDPATAQSGTTDVAAGTMYIGAGAKDTTSGGWDGRIDEVRIASAYRSAEWISTEYTNQSSPNSFIATSTAELSSRHIFTNPNVTATGNMIIDSGLVDFPTGIFTVGGSFDNNAVFNNRGGIVRFNAATTTVDVAAGSSPFSTLEFSGASGDFTISENATATAAISITAANEFTLGSGLTLTTLGTFSSSHNAATTTWTGSTLRLAGAEDYAINNKTSGGDTYGTLSLADGANVSLWNSSADTYVTEVSASIYSQDHAENDGDLYIFGNYSRSTGTEYWNHTTDFDGTDLSGGSERAVNVRGASSTVVTIDGATLDMRGVPSATTTIDAQSDAFTIIASSSSLLAEHFTVANLASTGFELVASTTVTTLADGLFTVTPGTTGITIDASTVDTNPAAQFFRVDFATTTPGSATNVTLTGGTPSSFVWFRDGIENLYGEDFDAGDDNPGNIRFDDSSFQIDISGTVYADDGVSPLGAPTCDGATNNVRVVVDDNVYTDTVSCDGSGAFTFANVSFVGDPTIVVYLDTDGGELGSVITKTPTADITDLDIYANRVITRHEDVAPLTIADMVQIDEAFDTDLRFVVATGSPDTLTVRLDTELLVASSTTFAPGGNITLESSGSGASYDGSLHLDDSASFIAAGSEIHQIGGSFFADATSTLTAASSTFTFTAMTTGKTISNDGASPLTFHELTFTGAGGGWNLVDDISVAADMTIATGTVTGTGDITMLGGTLGGNGLLSLGGGTTTIMTSTTLGGPQAWTFNDLVLGSSATTSTTTRNDTATTTILGTLTIASAHFLEANNSNWDLNGIGTVFIEDGTFLEGNSTVTYSGGGPVDVVSTTYHNLVLAGNAGTPVYTFGTLGVLIKNNLTVGGAVTSVADVTTNDPVITVGNNVLLTGNGELHASDSSLLTISGNYDNNATFISNGGEVRFDSADAYTVAAGTSDFADVTLASAGAVTITENATSTGVFTIASTTDFTQQSGTTLAVGNELRVLGNNTNWSGSTASLYSGEYEVNPKTVTVNFDTLQIGAGTQVRTWNASATSSTVVATGSWYSQDHAGVNGELYLFGDYNSDTRTDYWNYDTDFDGTDLAGGNERQATIYMDDGATAIWNSGTLNVIGTSSASTTIQNQGSGTYSLTIGGTASTDWDTATVRNIDTDGLQFTGTPNVIGLDRLDLLVESNDGSAMTVAGTAISASPARTFNEFIFNSDTGVTGAQNVTTVGSTLSGWRFTAHTGNLDGEDFDADNGNPGYIVWDDSDAIISISGTVYEADGVTESSVCDDSSTNIVLAVAGSLAQNASSSCSSADGSYTISGISFGSLDELTVYIDGEAVGGVTVTKDPISSIADMDIYERHVIVRHENTSPLTIADMAVWDSSDDADIPYTAVTGSPDTLTLPANTKLLIWNNKEFAPAGDVTLNGVGSNGAYDGSLEARAGANFSAATGETHTVGGNFTFAPTATFVAGDSDIRLTTEEAGRSVTVNEDSFYNLTFNGAGSWTITDATQTVLNDFTITNGTVTLSTATTTIGGSFVNSGNFTASGGTLLLTANSAGQSVTLAGSDAHELRFAGTGSWTMTDTNATATAAFTVATGTVTLPSGTLAVSGDFIVLDTITAGTNTLHLTKPSGTTTLTLSSNDLGSLHLTGAATTTMTDESVQLQGDLVLTAGELVTATNTVAIAGSLEATNGTLTVASSTFLFNANTTGHTVDLGSNELYNAVFANVNGGWTLTSATTTNTFALSNASSFTLTSGASLTVGGVFTNTVGDATTTWTNTDIHLLGTEPFSVNSRNDAGDTYATVTLIDDLAVRWWYSDAATTTIGTSSSLYSQDHANVDGDLSIYGDLVVSTSTEYWSYDTDFDGSSLTGGSERAVTVSLIDGASTDVTAVGTLKIIGSTLGTTTVQNSGANPYAFTVSGGTIEWDTYQFLNLPFSGVQATGTPTIASLSRGEFSIDKDGGTALRLERSVLDANPSQLISSTNFILTGAAISGVNVRLSATSTNAWRFSGGSGAVYGEAFDVDGVTECGSIRWDDSSCLLTEQTEYRWRHDDGGLGVPDDEWFATDFEYRKQVRVANNDATAYTDSVVAVTVPYDSDMRSDFADLRFTDGDGTTLTSHWLEKKVDSSEAQVWVTVPNLNANETTPLYMYYGSSTASSVSSSTAVFSAADDFENGLANYSGDTSKFKTDTTRKYGGARGLLAVTPSDFTESGLVRFDQTVSQGETIRTKLYVDTTVETLGTCTLFGVQSPANANENYAVCIRQLGTDTFMLSENAKRTGDYTGVTQLSSTNYTFSTSGWYEVEVDWGTDDSLSARLYNPSGTLVATTSATSNTYTSGGYGFMYWNNNGAWDGFHSRPQQTTAPSVWIGNKQVPGGANYASAQNTPTTAFDIGDTARVRVAIENTGLDILNQEFQIEYAAKGAAPSCGAVDVSEYAPVPVAASCGTNPLCMADSTFANNGDVIADLLAIARNQFAAGTYIENTSNSTAAFDLLQNRYTELEYALDVTSNATDPDYCFRITNDGASLDAYSNLPELSLSFTPTVSAVNFNDGFNVSLLPGTTTAVYASTSVSDLNGFADLGAATTTFFTAAVGAGCAADDNNCYISTTADTCSFQNCSGASCDLVCRADFAFHADPTDESGGDWFAFVEVEDTAENYAFNTSPAIDVSSLRALEVVNNIDYGALTPNSDTGSFNASTTINNIGNDAIDIEIEGSDLEDGFGSAIPAAQQRFATSTFTYTSCSNCKTLSTSTIPLAIDLTKPIASSPPVAKDIYWGIEIPFGIPARPHTGTNIFYVTDD